MSTITKKLKQCSHCQLFGHTKRTCSDVAAKTGSRLVRLQPGLAPSPHHLSLREEDVKPLWTDVPVYKAKRHQVTHRVAVDFAALIAAHNTSLPADSTVKTLPEVPAPLPVSTQPDETPELAVAPVHSYRERAIQRELLWASLTKEIVGWGQALQQLSLKRCVLSTIGLILVVSLPFPAVAYYQKVKKTNEWLVAESTNGFLALQASTVAALGSNMETAASELTRALHSFGATESLVQDKYSWLISLAEFLPIIGNEISSRQHLLLSGQHLALGNTYLVKGMTEVEADKTRPLTERLAIVRTHLRAAAPQYEAALGELQGVDLAAVPVEYQANFHDFTALFETFVDDMNDVVSLIDALQLLLGDTSFKRYLVVFQNQHELRPTGGFVGSMGVVDVQKGKIVRVDIPAGGSYDLQGQLGVSVIPPTPLQLVNGRWEFQDANWFPDFPASAEKLAWFYEQSRPETVDGVIAVNASVLPRVLSVLGPIADEQLGVMITEYDALPTLQAHVEDQDQKSNNQPKAILTDLLTHLLGQLPNLQRADAVRLLTELHGAAAEKEIQIYLRDAAAERRFQEFGWTGDVRPAVSNQDYLFVVAANLQGQKSDANIEQTITHEAVVDTTGQVIDTVTIRREHTGLPGMEWYGVPNISYLRVYVPEGAELISAEGFSYPPETAFHVPEAWYTTDADLAHLETNEQFAADSGTRVTNEFGKTVFGNWVMTAPQATSEVRLRYRLPFTIISKPTVPASNWERWTTAALDRENALRSRYSLLTQKQSGTRSRLEAKVRYPDGWVPLWRSDDAIDLTLNGARFETTLAEDTLFGVVFENQ